LNNLSNKQTPSLKKPWNFEQPLCREVGGEMFFAADLDDPDEMDTNIANVQMARTVCLGCEHREDCAEWGIRHERFGIWGGLSPRDLVETRKKRNIIIETVTLFRYIDD
jgi:hypothetical protein